MSFLKTFLISFLCIVFSKQTHAQILSRKSYKLFIYLKNAPFDSLYLRDYTEGRDILYPAKKTKKFTWEIIIPDSIILDSENMQLLVSKYNDSNNSSSFVRFISKKTGTKNIIANIGVEGKYNYIYGTYIGKTSFPNEPILAKINSKDTTIVGNVICEDFNLIIKDANSDIAVRAQDPFFSWFISSNIKETSYDNYLESYVKLSKKYPDSRFLISSLSRMVTRYKSKNDVEKIYKNFSDMHKNTIWAKNIEYFLYNKKFHDTSLLTSYNRNEYMVQDTSKYNLIVFTASWCKPCIEEIPLLKKIYKDLSKDLNITYVSIDNVQGVTSFQNLIQENHIPWRTLYAYKAVKKIKQAYFIEGIPHNILVYPNQDMEIVDIRKDYDRSKLYSIFNFLDIKSNNKKNESLRTNNW